MDINQVLAQYDLQEMLNRLNEVCGNGKPLTLNEKQAIRFMLEELINAKENQE